MRLLFDVRSGTMYPYGAAAVGQRSLGCASEGA
jgi:hypothetical protein